MPPISMTYFVDFIAKSGPAKLSVVRKFKDSVFNPQADYWKPMRDSIREFHRSGSTELRTLEHSIFPVSDDKKEENYRAVFAGFKKYIGKKPFRSVSCPRATYETEDASVRLNPEFAFERDGVTNVAKLHFKVSTKLNQHNVKLIHLMMAEAFSERDDTVYGILDVARANFRALANPDYDLLPLLEGEAKSFRSIYDRLPDPPSIRR